MKVQSLTCGVKLVGVLGRSMHKLRKANAGRAPVLVKKFDPTNPDAPPVEYIETRTAATLAKHAKKAASLI